MVVKVQVLLISIDLVVEKIFKDQIVSIIEQINGLQKQLKDMGFSDKDMVFFECIGEWCKFVLVLMVKLKELKVVGDVVGVSDEMNQCFNLVVLVYVVVMDEFVQVQVDVKKEGDVQVVEWCWGMMQIVFVFIVVVIVVLVIGVVWLICLIQQLLSCVIEVVGCIVDGDLMVDIVVDCSDEFGQLLVVLDCMMCQLCSVVGEV